MATKNKKTETKTTTKSKKVADSKAEVSSKEKVVKEDIKKEKHKIRLYFSFETRLFFKVVLFLLFVVSGTIIFINSFGIQSEKIVKYDENSNLDYKVYLFDNNFYEQDYLGKDMLYVASLIKNIGVDFNYTFNSRDIKDADFSYKVVGKLSITNDAGTKKYYEKTYNLLEDKNISMRNSNSQTINEQLTIDYPYYNSLANQFRSQYGVGAVSKLTVYMIINKKNVEGSKYDFNQDGMMTLNIPLSEKAVDINLDYQEINNTSEVIEKKNVLLESISLLLISLVLIVSSLVMLVKIMRSFGMIFDKKSAYDKYIGKILREYDRLVVESKTMVSLDDKEIIKIEKFSELLDVHDNLGLPIMYYQVAKHQKCYFYVYYNNSVYLNTVKSIDFEK